MTQLSLRHLYLYISIQYLRVYVCLFVWIKEKKKEKRKEKKRKRNAQRFCLFLLQVFFAVFGQCAFLREIYLLAFFPRGRKKKEEKNNEKEFLFLSAPFASRAWQKRQCEQNWNLILFFLQLVDDLLCVDQQTKIFLLLLLLLAFFFSTFFFFGNNDDRRKFLKTTRVISESWLLIFSEILISMHESFSTLAAHVSKR